MYDFSWDVLVLKLQFYYSRQECIIVQWRQWQPTPVLLPRKSHGRRSLAGCSPWGREELDMTERLHFHFSLLFIEEGNGNPLQCSCLENPRDGVAQSRTRLKWLSSSSNISNRVSFYLFRKLKGKPLFVRKKYNSFIHVYKYVSLFHEYRSFWGVLTIYYTI